MVTLRNKRVSVLSIAGLDIMAGADFELTEEQYEKLRGKPGIDQIIELSGEQPTKLPKRTESEADQLASINAETNEAKLREMIAGGLSGKQLAAANARLAKIAPPAPKN